ncbi:cyclic pyranopterin monophosphate synthase MoaC [Pontibacillus yanchengensis]|uniref:Cyclic pyranopterin monophosphate synthase n=1 Tax=Pontibacillus yanchengensis Y32 TaxID=1385514 RepID=A0A0A2TE46_9BACI|nr:cyclic pyranopterin monophosphate synthase MoaC [Pontibacillus yanchengensis]KGP72698.1 molybdenum cofactor biosynthesis protein C [Pontibacillus yanchengensis Y32]
MSEFTHFNEQGRAHMVDISEKQDSVRTAIACSSVLVDEEIFHAITENKLEKGDVLGVAQVAGIMAAKNTSNWIPMCHPLSLKGIDVSFEWSEESRGHRLTIQAKVKTKGSTGVEMEALTSASATALTVYDMCKALNKGMIIGETYLLEKTGGKSGDYHRSAEDKGEDSWK